MKEVNLERPDPDKPIEWTKYEGEEVIARMVIRQGKKYEERVYMPDKVFANPKGNAYVIGNGPSRKDFDLNTLKGSGQVYGCNALYRDFMPDFLFSVDRFMSVKIVQDKVYEQCICYAPNIEVMRSKEKLHLIPNNPNWISGSAAMHTACVHGHKNVYRIGFDFREFGKNKLNNIYQDTENYGPRHGEDIFEAWLYQFRSLCKRRPYVNFTVVHNAPPDYVTAIPFDNCSTMSYKEFNDKVLS